MKFTAIMAMAVVGFDCIEKASGSQSQVLFAPGYTWLWWLVAAAWLINALAMCFATVEL